MRSKQECISMKLTYGTRTKLQRALMTTLSFCFICTDETLRHTVCHNSELLQASTVLLPTGCISLLGNIFPWLWVVHSLMLLLLAWISENHMSWGSLPSSTRLKLPECVSETTKGSKLYGRHSGKSGCLDKRGSFLLSWGWRRGGKKVCFKYFLNRFYLPSPLGLEDYM